MEKTCTKCKEAKPVSEFGREPRNRDGLKSWCRACLCCDAKKRAAANPEAAKRRRKAWYEKNRESEIKKASEYTSHRYATDPEYRKRHNENARKRYARDPEKVRERTRKSKARAEYRARAAETNRARLDRLLADPELSKHLRAVRGAANARYRSRRRNTQVQPILIEDIIERDGSTCYLCERTLERREVTLDHVKPLSRGGSHIPHNIRIACRSCNSRKKDKLLSELDWYHGDDPTALDDIL